MPLTIEDSPERAAFRTDFRDWLRDELPSAWIAAIETGDDDAYAAARQAAENDGWNPFAWMRTIGESGYAAPLWPKEYGGLSGEPWMQQVIREELNRHRLPTIAPNILGVGLAGPTIVTHGSEEQKERHLRPILSGEHIWCQLFSEPGSGSDLASLGTRAVRDGDEYVVNGQKVWTSVAQLAHYGMLLARTNPEAVKHEGLSYFLLDMKSPGIDIRPLRQLTGSSEFNEVYFTDARIPASSLLGTEGEGWRYARTTLMNERLTLSGVSLDTIAFTGGTRRDAWTSFLESIPDRSDPVVRQQVTRFYIEQKVKELTAFRANAARARGAEPGPEGSGAKIVNASYNQRRSSFQVTAAGMNGVAWERGDRTAESRSLAFLRALANSIEGGTTEILKSQVAERVLGLPREPDVDKGLAWKDSKRS